jgi:phosphatidylserine/phosphatidylglycerophosphate/cardiolipin synthase-like enzyme
MDPTTDLTTDLPEIAPPAEPVPSAATPSPTTFTSSSATPPATTAETPPEATPPKRTDEMVLSKEKFNERIEQAKRAERKKLIEAFGTDDPNEIRKIKSELEEMRKEREERERAKMSEVERLNADLEKARKEADAWRTKARAADEQRAFEKQDSIIRKIASRYVGDDYVDDVAFLYARQVLTKVSPRDAAKMTDKDVEKWFASYAKSKPAFARVQPSAAPAPAPAPKPEPERRPLTTGARPVQRPMPNTTNAAAAKTAKPGMPNTMSKAEWEAEKRKRGISY